MPVLTQARDMTDALWMVFCDIEVLGGKMKCEDVVQCMHNISEENKVSRRNRDMNTNLNENVTDRRVPPQDVTITYLLRVDMAWED